MQKTSIVMAQKAEQKKRNFTQGKPVTLPKVDVGSQEVTLEGVKRIKLESSVDSVSFKVPGTSQERERRKERKERFVASNLRNGSSSVFQVDPLYKPLSAPRIPSNGVNGIKKYPTPEGQLVGENQNLEKPYLRLTTYPRKEDVRPLKVLIKALAHIKSRYVQDEDFEWANEQLKSVRQDMTVQRIQNRLVLDVYETHARLLLEHGDLDEFNQCQTMIRSLTEGTGRSNNDSDDANPNHALACHHLNGETSIRDENAQQEADQPLHQSPEGADEFRGYAILYALVRNSRMELKTELARAKAAKKGKSCHAKSSCFHAVSVVKAIDDNDYRTFFRLYECAPNMSAYLMDFLVKRVRDQAYERIISAYRPNVSVEYFRECLRFPDLEETRLFLRQRKAVFVDETTTGPLFWVDCKASIAKLLLL